MKDDILGKIQNTLDGSLNREADVVYLLTEIRKYLDASREAGYSKLRLFCNWVVHSELDGWRAQQIVSFVDDYLQKSFKMGCTEEDMQAFEAILNLNDFRSQLRDFLVGHTLPHTVCEDENWIDFLSLYAQVVEDCPLTLTGAVKPNSLIDRMVVSFVENHSAGSAAKPESFFPMDWEFFRSGVKRGTLKLRTRGELVGSTLEWL